MLYIQSDFINFLIKEPEVFSKHKVKNYSIMLYVQQGFINLIKELIVFIKALHNTIPK